MIFDRPSGRTRRLTGLYATAEAIAARDHNNLYLTSCFFQDPERYKAFCAFYALMRIVDDRIDEIPDRALLPEPRRSREHEVVEAWERSVLSSYEGLRPSREMVEGCEHPDADAVLEAFARSVGEFPVPRDLWVNFFRSMRWDIDHDRFATWNDFVTYAEGASVSPTTIYLVLLASGPEHSLGRRTLPDGIDLNRCGRELGIFAYVAHIIRDIAEDLRVGRRGLVYLTREDMKRHGVTEDALRADLRRGRARRATRSLVADLVGRARSHLAAGRTSMARLSGNTGSDCAFILELVVTMYERVIDKIEACGFDPMTGRHRLTAVEKEKVVLEVARGSGFQPTVPKESSR